MTHEEWRERAIWAMAYVVSTHRLSLDWLICQKLTILWREHHTLYAWETPQPLTTYHRHGNRWAHIGITWRKYPRR